MKKGILLINLGTPDSPSVSDVRKYLREFLMDARVIDMPYIPRWFLVNVIIATFRAPKSAHAYQSIWDNEKGSPLMYYSKKIAENWQKEMGDEVIVELAMRYQSPSIKSALERLKQQNITELEIIPLFPQYASSTSGSAIEKAMEIINTWETIPSINIVSSFFHRPKLIEGFTKVLAENAKKLLDKDTYDYILFSYHGVPERHIHKSCDNGHCQLGDCCQQLSEKNQLCYRAQCFETTKLIAGKLGLDKNQYQTVFQSRLTTRAREPWLQPYADEVITALGKGGKKKLLVFSPAFVADCLETIEEIGEEYKELFQENGGEHLQLVESLNDTSIFTA